VSIVTLTTDLGYRDPYLGIVKARLYGLLPDVKIIDLACDVRNNAISDAAFVLKNAIDFFPDDTVHLVGVKLIVNNSQLNQNNKGIDNTRYLLTRYRNQYIVCLDNGLLSLIDENFSEAVYQIYYDTASRHKFFMKDIFVDAAVHLSSKKPIDEIALKTDDYYKAFLFNSYKNEHQLRGKNLYVDDFGNVITNISRDEFYNTKGNRSFTIILPGALISQISETYDDVKFGDVLALFNSFGLLEIAVNGKSAYQLLHPRQIGKEFDFNLLIEFND
jgi:S-adenosyl-L-methionine hydrolase (adenosine-forming)